MIVPAIEGGPGDAELLQGLADTQGLFRHHLLELAGLPAQLLDLGAAGGPLGIASQAALSSFEKLLGPGIVQALGDALAAAQFGDAGFTAKAIQHDPDLLF